MNEAQKARYPRVREGMTLAYLGLGATAAFACVPFFGFLAWVAALPAILFALYISIALWARSITQDALVMAALTVLVFPVWVLFAPALVLQAFTYLIRAMH